MGGQANRQTVAIVWKPLPERERADLVARLVEWLTREPADEVQDGDDGSEVCGVGSRQHSRAV